MPLGGKYGRLLLEQGPTSRRCGARTRNGRPCKNWALPGKTRCKLHGSMSAGPRIFFDPQSVAIRKERTAKMVEGRRVWLAILKAEGSKAPWGRKKKGAIPDPLSKPLARLTKVQQKRALDRKGARAYLVKKTRFLAEQARAQTEREAAAERERQAMSEAMRPQQDFVNWDRVQKEAGRRYLIGRAYDTFLRCGGWGDLESGPMPRKHGVLDDPRMQRRFAAEDLTGGIKRY